MKTVIILLLVGSMLHSCGEDIQSRAEQGNPWDQFNLGLKYAKGEGVPQSDTEAAKWYKRAADQGVVEAQYNLGLMHYQSQDFTLAMKWLKAAGERDTAGAQYLVGTMYYKGSGCKQDHSKAASWFEKAADLGHAKAQYNLGVMYAKGQGVPQSKLGARKWYKRAADQGFEEAEKALERLGGN